MEATPDDWLRREALLDRLLDLPEAERAAFIDALAREDAGDAAALRGWLAGIAHSASYLLPKATPEPISRAGEAVGNWRALRLLGRGGMGEVWLGERADGLFARQVAIKFLRDDRPALAHTIESERRVLAGLQHPGIVRLLDAGALANGQPYLVTDYIDGQPLDVWLAQRQPALAARLALFAQVAAAVAHAHGQLVVHRDIKPGNVLVDAQAHAHLLDFGIARALAHAADAAEATQVALTPEFAAPELVADNSASVRSDVYALGGLLYYLLCGRPPLALRGLALGAMVTTVRDMQPDAPTIHAPAVVKQGASPALLADLDAIALKALAKAPADRYATVDALLADVAAAQAHRPLSARAPNLYDRARRYLRRHRIGVAVAALLLVSLLGGMVGTLWQAHEARVQQRRAEAEAAHAAAQARAANAVRDFLIGVFESANPEVTQGRTPTALELVDAGVRQAETGLAGQPEMQARLFDALGRTYLGLGEYAKAAELLKKGHDTAAEAFGAASPLAVELALAYGGAVGRSDGPDDDARRLLQPIWAREAGVVGDALRQRAVAGVQLAALHQRSGQLQQAAALFDRAIPMLRGLGLAAGNDLAEALYQRAGLDAALGHRNDAIVHLQQAIALHAERPLPSDAGINPPRVALANLLSSAGRNDEAVAILREVVASNHAVYGPAHPRYLESRIALGRGLVRQSAYAEADALLGDVLASERARHGPDSEIAAKAEVALAASKFAQGELDEAIALNASAARYIAAHDGRDSYRAILMMQNVVRLQLDKGDYAAAEKTARQVLADLRRIGSDSIGDALDLLGDLRRHQGDAEGARRLHLQALAALAGNGDTGSFDVQMLKAGLAEDEADAGRFDDARRHAREALDGLRGLEQASNEEMAGFVRYLLAGFDVRQGHCSDAGAADIDAQLATMRDTALSPHAQWRIAYARLLLGQCRRQQGKANAALHARIAQDARFLRASAIASPQAKRFADAALAR